MRKLLLPFIVLALTASGCAQSSDTGGDSDPTEVVVYSGRSEELVGPVVKLFEEKTGIKAKVRYGDTAELAAAILEEGDNSPADVFWASDAGALGALEAADRLAPLPEKLLANVEPRFRSPEGVWTGTSGRVRVLAYSTELSKSSLPKSVLDLTGPDYKGRVGWAPTNGSFQAFVTAMRIVHGDAVTKKWLEGMKANGTKVYEKNSAIVKAIAAGEIELGLVNHYYVLELGKEDPTISEKVANYFFASGDVGSLVNVAGAGILDSASSRPAGEKFIEFLLSREGSEYFDEEVYEYPVTTDGVAPAGLPALSSVKQPDVDLSDLKSLDETLQLLRSAGVL